MLRLSCLLLAICACGGGESPVAPDPDDLTPGVGDDPGTGTGTLLVDGNATASPLIDNATDPAGFTTQISLRVARTEGDVTEGTVQLHSLGGTVDLTFDPATMRWRGAQNSYHQVYQLDVTSGDDDVVGVRLEGPDIHAFSTPLKGATVDSTIPLDIAWTRAEAATVARLRTRDLDVEIEDSGAHALAANSLRSKPDDTEDERLELLRSRLITPAGATPGSSFRIGVDNRIDLVVQPAP